ncbi:hypothetical protein AH362_001727 [Salmonella enterica subsp. enterica]|nr:hypothetical protein [Salmonella enterica subsp. enterica]EDT7019732.1 hypothetical protein [Salmonella enterica subsp. enterica]EEA8587328.1 hypothetical protein [Salmonella enterica subsp. enterica]EEC0353866.1 hypothetical protein [Salmonella enterica subsp. enterica]
MITEKNNVFYCDCGFSFQRGRSGAHDCADGLRNKLDESEAKCAALAAELQSVKAMNDCLSEELRGYESDGTFDGPKMHLLWWQCETPNHDAFLAEVRASAIDSLVDIKTKQLADMHPDTHAFVATAMSIRSQINELQVFAAQLRKGAQS